MFKRNLLSASLLVLAVACGSAGEEEGVGLFDGTSKDGWSSAGDSSIALDLAEDGEGNSALSVRGDFAENASFSLEIDPADAAGSAGITFRIRGSMNVQFSATTNGIKPVEAGGTCVPTDAMGCWDFYATDVGVTTEWQTVTISWEQLQQSGVGVSVPFDLSQITHINFHPQGSGVFNIWIDDVDFVDSVGDVLTPTGSGGAASGGSPAGDGDGDLTASGGTIPATGGTSAGGTTNMSDNRLGKYVDINMFLASSRQINSIYTYTALLDAVDQFPDFAACCSETQKKREIAAFMAHVEHETDKLAAPEEYTPPSIYCQSGLYMCAAGKSYHGRGALQLTWNYNYHFAEDYFATKGKIYDLVARPEQVSTSTELVWTTALWFWMEGDPSYVNDTMHDRINGQGFGATIRKINGALECDGAGPQQVQQRIDYYLAWCTRLGVDPGSNLSC